MRSGLVIPGIAVNWGYSIRNIFRSLGVEAVVVDEHVPTVG
jgi:hypothetical protein